MPQKIIILALVTGLTLLGSLGFVFGNGISLNSNVSFIGSASKTIFLDTPHLDSTIVVFQSDTDISSAIVTSNCTITSKFLTNYKGLSFFEVDYSTANDCKNGSIVLEMQGKKIPNSLATLEIKNQYREYALYLDYPTESLKHMFENLEKQQKKYAIYKNYKGQDIARYFNFLQGQRKFYEVVEQKNLIEKIISARGEKYVSPVPEKRVQEKFTKIPNSARPYRAQYTDGIHHGWDIDAPIGTDTVALDDGIIVRVVHDFSASDFSRIVYGENLGYEQKLKNLDILRGKQVWLKTMKGEVVFYSHLDTIPTDITEGSVVKRGEKLGTVGISGVPEEGYSDSHLHFEIAQNSYDIEQAGSYDFGDYMSWPWLTKGMNETQTLEAQKNIFQ